MYWQGENLPVAGSMTSHQCDHWIVLSAVGGGGGGGLARRDFNVTNKNIQDSMVVQLEDESRSKHTHTHTHVCSHTNELGVNATALQSFILEVGFSEKHP